MTTVFQTSDFLTASTLVALRCRLLGIDRSDPRRAVFSFERTTELETDVERLRRGELRVDPNNFWAAERRIKQWIHEGSRP